MWRPKLALATTVFVLSACAARAGKFDEEEAQTFVSGLKFAGLLDFRAYTTSRDISWLRGGPGKLRYGGRDTDADGRGDRAVNGAAIPQVSLVVEAAVIPNAKIHVQTNFSTDSSSGPSRVGVIEVYAEAETGSETAALRIRAGGYIPRVSWEHPDPAWSTRYTLTPSATGSWISEEVRALGAQAVWERTWLPGCQTRLTAGGFSGGDQIGRLLWFRGWALHDYQADLSTQYTVQGRNYSPLEELDGRLGYYGRADLDLFDHAVQLGGGGWTNNANDHLGQPGIANLDTQAFRTRFFHYGGKLEWKRWVLISQFMKVTVSALDKAARDWNAAYVLGSLQWGKARLSGRYDRFWALNWENGHAFTGFLAWDFSVRQQIGVEFVYSNARPNESVRPLREIDRLGQFNYRLRF